VLAWTGVMRSKERVCNAVWSHGDSGGVRDAQDWGASVGGLDVAGSDGDDGDDGGGGNGNGNAGAEVVVIAEGACFLDFFLDGMVGFAVGMDR